MKLRLSPMITAPAPIADRRDALFLALVAAASVVAASAALLWSLPIHG